MLAPTLWLSLSRFHDKRKNTPDKIYPCSITPIPEKETSTPFTLRELFITITGRNSNPLLLILFTKENEIVQSIKKEIRSRRSRGCWVCFLRIICEPHSIVVPSFGFGMMDSPGCTNSTKSRC